MALFNNKRAQVSLELLILMGFLTFVIIGILGVGYYYSSTINDRIRSTQVANFAGKIISASETVFYSGEPSKATITTYLPDNIEDIEINSIENIFIITYNLTSGRNVAAYPSSVPIEENSLKRLTTSSGIKKIVIVAESTNAVISQE
jgi:uncharacterized protein (UPF0333 family)